MKGTVNKVALRIGNSITEDLMWEEAFRRFFSAIYELGLQQPTSVGLAFVGEDGNLSLETDVLRKEVTVTGWGFNCALPTMPDDRYATAVCTDIKDVLHGMQMFTVIGYVAGFCLMDAAGKCILRFQADPENPKNLLVSGG